MKRFGIMIFMTVVISFCISNAKSSKLTTRSYQYLIVDSTQKESIVEEIEPSPDDFTPTSKDPELNYAELSKNIVYPETAQRDRLSGKVLVRVLVGKDGKIKPGKYRIEDSTNEIFTQSAIDAIMKTSFTPAYQKGQPVAVWVTVPIVFRLR